MAFPDDYTRQVQLTIPSAKIPAGRFTEVTLWLGNDWTPDEFRDADGSNAPQSDGGDVVITKDAAGLERWPVHVARFSLDNNPANSNVSIFTLAPLIESGSDFTFWLWYASDVTETQPAVGAAFGRDECFAQYGLFSAFNERTTDITSTTSDVVDDYTGNGNNGDYTSGDVDNEMTVGEADRLNGNLSFENVAGSGNDEGFVEWNGHDSADFGLDGFHIGVICSKENNAGNIFSQPDDNTGQLRLCAQGNTNYQYGGGDGVDATVASGIAAGSPRFVNLERNWAYTIFEDGAELAQAFTPPGLGAQGNDTTPFAYGSEIDSTHDGAAEVGKIELCYTRIGSITLERHTLEYRAYYGDTAFLTVGTPQAPGGNPPVTLTIRVLDGRSTPPPALQNVRVRVEADETAGGLTQGDAVIDGVLTDVNGEVSDTRSYTENVDLVGVAREDVDGSPHFQQGDIIVTKDALANQTVTVILQTDE